MMDYESVHLKEELVIQNLYTVHYYEYNNDYFFPGEAHAFWEFLYVDKGEVEVTAGSHICTLKKGDIIFHKPMEFHNLRANGVVAPNLVVVSFECNSPAMNFFEDKILRVSDAERNLLATIIQEASLSYSTPLDDPNLRRMERVEQQPFAAEQFIKSCLELMLLQLIRKRDVSQSKIKTTSSMKERTDQDVLNRIILYLEKNVQERITLDDICRDNLIGRSYLQKMFREKIGGGVMEYFGRLKIEAAKQSIRESSGNFTEIARELGYTSIHYFSRHFKKVTGMTPSEYASSVKVKTESSREQLSLLRDIPVNPYR